MPDQIDDEVKNHRAEIIMESQMNIMDRLGEKQVGRDITVLTEGFDRYAECWFGRSAMDAPDIDGKVFSLRKRSRTTVNGNGARGRDH